MPASGDGGPTSPSERVDLGDIPGDQVTGTETVDLGATAPPGQVTPTDHVRKMIVRSLLIAGLIIIVGGFVSAIWGKGDAWSNTKDLLDLLVPAETALLGAAVAFYMTGSN